MEEEVVGCYEIVRVTHPPRPVYARPMRCKANQRHSQTRLVTGAKLLKINDIQAIDQVQVISSSISSVSDCSSFGEMVDLNAIGCVEKCG
ncbi:hypothetical protein M8C21_022765 [Ambrosia artemisiifolia]|uniref:Uncharacterized protein n=1 Tax=Ambrosia artemisiifolia TaxID=4212 RepID=A0AAD5DGH0_AMBAR|nr:hypothetical protein M8C21_022765 [Ambrosia artemisiifolia]